jgi:hypothetical protein
MAEFAAIDLHKDESYACLVQQIEQLLDAWSMAPSAKAIQAMRGIALITNKVIT